MSFLWVLPLSLVGCGAPPLSVRPPSPSAAPFPSDSTPLPVYRSKRLALSLPLPDGKAWRIDDHSRPELVATHAPTRSRLVVAVFDANELVGRRECEERARARNLVPGGPDDASPPIRAVEDVVTMTQGTFDTHIEVTLEPGRSPASRLEGRVMAFGGFLRKCYVFVYSTDVDGADEEPVLSARLALVRARVLGGLELRPFDAVSRDSIVGP